MFLLWCWYSAFGTWELGYKYERCVYHSYMVLWCRMMLYDVVWCHARSIMKLTLPQLFQKPTYSWEHIMQPAGGYWHIDYTLNTLPGKAGHRTIGLPWYRYVQQTLLICNTKVQTSNCLWWQMICKELTFTGCSWGQYLLSTYLHTHREMKGSLRCLTSPRDLQRQPYTCYACLTVLNLKHFRVSLIGKTVPIVLDTLLNYHTVHVHVHYYIDVQAFISFWDLVFINNIVCLATPRYSVHSIYATTYCLQCHTPSWFPVIIDTQCLLVAVLGLHMVSVQGWHLLEQDICSRKLWYLWSGHCDCLTCSNSLVARLHGRRTPPVWPEKEG